MKFIHILLITVALALATPVQARDAVVVRFVDAQVHADAGQAPWDADANRAALARHLQDLGRRHLAASETLTIDVRDVDLAGTVIPFARRLPDVRVTHGRADWPRVEMRYTLTRDGKVLLQGDEVVVDLDYQRPIRGPLRHVDLAAEKRMLTQWFDERFGSGRALTATRP